MIHGLSSLVPVSRAASGTVSLPRRRVLAHAGAAAMAVPLLALPRRARAEQDERSLSLWHTHTGERLTMAFAVGGSLLRPALARLDRFLRDHYSGAVGHIDPGLYEQLFALQTRLGSRAAFEVISGFRSPRTNDRLRQRGGGGVARASLHMQGRAIDVRLPDVALADLRDAALELRAGGVGYYARERFVHLDTGRVRSW